METLQTFLNDTNVYLQAGFAHVNAVQGLLIAIIAAFLMYRWSSVFVVAVGATVVHMVADVMLPVLANSAPFRLPPLVDGEYWRYVLALYVGYLAVITVFYIVKRVLVGVEHQAA
jgi:MFS superfamily sulfate permease-like transporter